MLDDLSRPARLPSEAIALPAMEPARGSARGTGALSAVRRNWPSVQPEQRPLRAANPVTMGRAALQSVLSGS
jgi:hypothetical protein